VLCIRPDASVAQWPVRKQRRWRYAQCRELLLSCLTQLAEGSNLVQAVSVGCCRYFVALVVELEAIARSNDSGT